MKAGDDRIHSNLIRSLVMRDPTSVRYGYKDGRQITIVHGVPYTMVGKVSGKGNFYRKVS